MSTWEAPALGAVLPERKPLGERDSTERLGEDDMATLHEAQFLEAARLHQQRMASRVPAPVRGVCTNCGAACLPRALYCDEDCRDDHQARQTTARRTGAGA